MLIKSRRRSTKSSGGVGGLGDWVIEDDGDACRDRGGGIADTLLYTIWWFGPQNHRHDGLSGLGLKTWLEFWWEQEEARVIIRSWH